MPRNIEIKARVDDMSALCRLVEGIADSGPELIRQSDTFFNCPRGRLKLRVIDQRSGELIYYQRPDTAGPSESHYKIFPVGDPPALRETLHRAYGTLGIVEKERTLYRSGQTRIHLDRVNGLGEFMELEVVLARGQTAGEGEEIARVLMERLGVATDHLLERAYIDLLLEQGG
jgi:predicted adenylyl cyclase CyaB